MLLKKAMTGDIIVLNAEMMGKKSDTESAKAAENRAKTNNPPIRAARDEP